MTFGMESSHRDSETSFRSHRLVTDLGKWTTSNCHHCKQTILGLVKPGLKCLICERKFHRDCILSISPCQIQIMGSTEEHNFELRQYYKPTDCDYCECLLVGLIKQGMQCTKCLYNVHEKCRDKVLSRCNGGGRRESEASYSSSPRVIEPNLEQRSPVVDRSNGSLSLNSSPALSLRTDSDQTVVGQQRRSVPVFRLFERLSGLRVTKGGPTVIKEDFLLHSTSFATMEIERNFWRLDSRSIQFFRTKPEEDGASAQPDSVLNLSDISSIESLTNQRYNFVIRTKNGSSFYVVVPQLDRYQIELGINLTSSWETQIRLAVIAHNEDHKNQRPASEPEAPLRNPADPPRSPVQLPPSGASRRTTLTSTIKYNIVSDNILGSGQFGTVYEAVEEDTGNTVAVKIIDKGRFSFPNDSSSTLRNEVNILRDLSHPGVVKLLNVFENGEIVCVVMEKMNGGDLLEYVLTRPDKTISERQSRFFAYQILTAIKYLHKRDVVHCDLKPENILLLTSNPDPAQYYDSQDPTFYPHQVKLCDFGFSRIIGESSFRNSLVGTPAYLAPEVMSSRPIYNRSLDLWSVGVCLYVCLTSFFPFDSPADILATSTDMSKLFPIEMWENASYACVNLIQQLLQTNYEARPTVDRALSHIWFSPSKCFPDLQTLEEIVGLRWLTKDISL